MNVALAIGAALVVIGTVAVGVALYRNKALLAEEARERSQNVQHVVNPLIGSDMSNPSNPRAADKYYTMVRAAAVPAQTIKISNCQPTPQAASVQVGQEVTVQNSDSTAHQLVNGNILSVKLPANGSATFTMKSATPQAFNYACDGTSVGTILVSDK